MSRLAEAPFFVGRADVVDAVEEALLSTGSVGAVLVGDAGVGKTAVMQQALASRAAELLVVRIRGSKGSYHQAFRPVNFLLSELDTDVIDHPVTVLRAVSELLNFQARGRRVVLAVDNIEYLDPSSASLITQLVLNGTASVLLTSQDFTAADSMFASLWREGSLKRFDLSPFTVAETRAFLEAELEGPVSVECVHLLLRMSGGNARFLQASTRALRGRRIIEQDGTWVLLPGGTPVPTEVTEAAGTVLEGLPAAQRDVAHLLALAGGLPIPAVHRLAGSADVDALQSAGLVVVRHGKQEYVELADPVLAAGAVESLAAPHAQDLYDRLADDAALTDALDPERHARWLLRCHRPVPEALALAAARSASNDGRYCDAIEFTEIQDAHRTSAGLAAERVRALIDAGRFEDAANALSLAAPLVGQASPVDAVRMLLADAALRNFLGLGGVEDPLTDADGSVEAADPEDRDALRAEILLARAEIASLTGDYARSRELMQSLQAAPYPLGPEHRIRSEVLLCEAWAMMESQLEALQLADDLADRLQHGGVSHRTREIAYLRLVAVYSASGSWGSGARRLGLDVENGEAAHRGSSVQLALGLVLGRYGQPEDALGLLKPAFDQLRIADPHRLLPIAAASIAYCHTMNRNIQDAIPFLSHAEPSAGVPWMVRRLTSQLQLSSLGLREAKSEAAQQLQVLGQRDRERGASLFELSAFTSSVRLGNTGALGELSDVAARVQGPFARLSEMFAKGVGHRDAEVLLQAMELAAAAGDQNFGRDAARSALSAAQALGNKSTVREVQQRARQVLVNETSGGPISQLESLTPRESEIAQLAAGGYANREIADIMCVSVRTIEGHLYQIYSKLHVSSRLQLAELLPTPLQ
ncbi:LuxR C-terminal-related transcriptional regulator [Arthrobacter agilis]|uniref:LuxR C-terminal-related transcriptional regulator n=1 Tax=Arthrobacter agilis TaxID=37921 RepID=UPI00278034E8|nr:LuxR C-terminal-related transcriptional regulator [Arthrobacter agilis]MDQ0734037.1 DNA-binding CsgD family transcriptional regulator [Arthrobacter agilis]